MPKLRFPLDVDDGWPPVAVEGLWCARRGTLFELENAPFFLHGLARADRFHAEVGAEDGLVLAFRLVEPSGHSLLWVLDQDGVEFAPSKGALLALGCSVEGFPRYGLHAVDVPPSVTPAAINALVDDLEERGLALAFPVWRHADDADVTPREESAG